MSKLMLYKSLFFVSFLVLSVSVIQAQRKLMPSIAPKSDSTKYKDSIELTKVDTSTSAFLARIENVSVSVTRYSNKIRRGYSIDKYMDDLDIVENGQRIIDSILRSGSTIADVNLRNISSFKVITNQFDKQLTGWKKDFESFTQQMVDGYKEIATSMGSPVFRKVLGDSILQVQYLMQVNALKESVTHIKNKRDSIFRSLSSFESRVATAYIKNGELSEEIQYRIFRYSTSLFGKTHQNIWKSRKSDYSTPLKYDLKSSFSRTIPVLLFYISNSLPLLILNLFFGVLFLFWIFISKRGLIKKGTENLLSPLRYIVKFPLFSSLLIIFISAPFISTTPPASFVELMWFFASIFASFFIWKYEPKVVKVIWIISVFLYIYFGIDNLLYDYSLEERYYLLVGNLIALFICFLVFRSKDIEKHKRNWIYQWSIIIFLICNIFAFFLNIFGHVAIAKLLSNSSILQLVLAVSLSHLSEIFTEAIYIQLERSKDSVYAAYLEYDNIRKKFKSFLNMGAILVWIVGFLWSLSFLDSMQQYFFQFLDTNISLGSLSFTPGSVLIFSITIWISVILSNIISVVFGTSEQQFASTKKNKVGSWMMLVRLAVISCGFFIAVAAAGIPVDKLAIVFGALSVGIGFGLQNVVGNLVSGIILAFEKPMQVGDVIEIGSQNGTVKQIGIRSSKITTFDGAEIIVPNGDFISQKLTNWTHTNQFRRIEVIVGVAYGSPIEKVTDIILAAVMKQENVMAFPKPVALVHEFADSSVNFRVLFWTKEYETWTILKSSSLTAIYNSFAENGITIPFPQRDLYLKELPKKEE